MNKRIALLLASIFVVCTMLVTAVPAYAANSGLSLSDGEGLPSAEEEITLTFTIPVASDIADISVKIAFEKEVFEVISVTAPSLDGAVVVSCTHTEANDAGQITATYDSESSEADVAITGDGLAITAVLKVKADANVGDAQFTVLEFVVNSLEAGITKPVIEVDDLTNATAVYKVIQPVTGVTVDETLELCPGESKTLTAVVAPNNAANKNVEFVSDNTEVATVDGTGKVTAVAAGTANITVTTQDGGKTDACEVTVTDHDYNSEWNHSASGHWQECGNCNGRKTLEPHVPGPAATATDPQVCTVCGFVIAPAVGVSDVQIGHHCTACPTCGGCLDINCLVIICQNKCKAGAMNFTDVKEGDKYYSAVEYVYHRQLMIGVSDTEFAINEDLDRAMIVRILWNLEGSPKVYTANPFKDVASDSWYYDAVKWAANKGLIKGYDAETFGPTDPITREQMVTILHRYAAMKRFNVYTFNSRLQLINADASAVSEYAVTPMRWAVGNSILETKSGLIAPTDVATRAEVAQTLKSFLEFYK